MPCFDGISCKNQCKSNLHKNKFHHSNHSNKTYEGYQYPNGAFVMCSVRLFIFTILVGNRYNKCDKK